MAVYGTKYYSRVFDLSGNTFQINLKYKNYTGSTIEILEYPTSPLNLSYKGGRDDIDNPVKGSELTFDFWIKSGQTYTDLLESELRDWQLDLLKNSNLIWRGWLQPENLVTRFIVKAYLISISATDGLADLQNQDYLYNPFATGTTSFIQLVKNIVNQTEIPLNIRSQMNIYDSHLSGSTTFLKDLLVNEKRFVKYDKKIKFEKAYDSLGWLVDSFNSTFAQVNGSYSIWQKNEIVSNIVTYNINNLTASTITNNSRLITIPSDQKYGVDADELSKIRPAKYLENTFSNRDSGRWWTKNIKNPNFYIVEGALTNTVFVAYSASTNSYSAYYSSPVFETYNPADDGATTTFVQILTGSTLTLKFDLSIDYITWSNPPASEKIYPTLVIKLFKSGSGGGFIREIERTLPITGVSKTYIEDFLLQNNSDTGGTFYSFQFIIKPQTTATAPFHVKTFKYTLKNMNIFNNYDSQNNIDYLIKGINVNSNAIATNSVETYFGDTKAVGNGNSGIWEVGSYQYAPSANTDNWFNAGYKSVIYNPNFVNKTNWDESSSGITWVYNTNAGGYLFVKNSGGTTNFSKIITQSRFEAGTYNLSIEAKNNSSISGSAVNGNLRLGARDLTTGVYSNISTKSLTSNNTWTTYTFTGITLSNDFDLGFQVDRPKPGTDLDIAVRNFKITYTSVPPRSLQKLNTLNKAQRANKFRNYLRLNVQNAGTININNVLSIQNKYYDIVALEYNLMLASMTLDLVENIQIKKQIDIEETLLIEEG